MADLKSRTLFITGASRGAASRSPCARPGTAPTSQSRPRPTLRTPSGPGTIHTAAQITGKAASMGEGVVLSVLDALIKDFTQNLERI